MSATSSKLRSKKLSGIPRSSQQLCAQRLACISSQAVAKYHCQDCLSILCTECHLFLHQSNKNLFHQYTPLPEPDPKTLCSNPCKNFADLTCVNCQKNYCFGCDRQFHSRKEKAHHLRKEFEFEEEEQFFSLSPDEKMMDHTSIPDVTLGMPSLVINCDEYPTSPICEPSSFLLLDQNETLMVNSEKEFLKKLGCEASVKAVKVMAIFGNTGDGKSYTLNQVCFGGREVFPTSDSQDSCTAGVWAAYDPSHSLIALDTEGFLGQTANETQRHRLLLKILAVSDVVVYRTRAPRLTCDLFTFLGHSSRIYLEHFTPELERVARVQGVPSLSSLGPSVLVFHETHDTQPLRSEGNLRPVDKLMEAFQAQNIKLDAFKTVDYCGVQTKGDKPTDFSSFLSCLEHHLSNQVRSARPPGAVYQAIKTLNDKFSGAITSRTLLEATVLDSLFQSQTQS